MITNFHLIMGIVVSFIVTNVPEPLDPISSIIVGIICAGAAFVLSVKDRLADGDEKTTQDE